MHFHAEHAFFFERRQPMWRAVSGLVLTLCVLTVNAGASSPAVSFSAGGVGALLLVLARIRGHRRVEPAMAWVGALALLSVLGGVALGRDMRAVTETASRVGCGVIWVLWLGTQIDWASLRQILRTLRVPDGVVAALDHALMHGVLTQREWARRRDAARLRLGRTRLPLASWGALLGEGALQAFVRLERVEENGLVRSRASEDADACDGVQLEGVDVERDGQRVVEQLELRLGREEWVVVCGPSGAGKSSLLRLLAGLDAPVQGKMTRLGIPVGPGATLRARLDGRVALLGQNADDHFIASTVAEDIAWGLVQRGVEAPQAKRRAEDIAKALRVEHLLGRPCHAISFGEQRRVALAGLLVLEPALLLLDEPTSGLDPVAARELRVLVEAFTRRTGAACVWATHDLHSLPAPAKRVILMRERRIVFDGAASDGLSQRWLVKAGLALPPEESDLC